MDCEDIIQFYIDNDVLISPDAISMITNTPVHLNSRFTVINKDVLGITGKEISNQLVVEDFERALVLKEKHKNSKLYDRFINYILTTNPAANVEQKQGSIGDSAYKGAGAADRQYGMQDAHPTHPSHPAENIVGTNIVGAVAGDAAENIVNIANKSKDDKDVLSKASIQSIESDAKLKEKFLKDNKIRIVSSYSDKTRKWSVQDFIGLYNSRFKELEKILRSRTELQNLTSISRISSKKERENVALIGVVYDKALTKSGNIMLTIEDPTGMIKAVINKTKEDLFRLAEEIQLDETIGLTGMFDQIIFANSLFLPDIPLTKELKKSPDEGYFLVIADTQLGSKLFLEKEFDRLLAWINCEVGNEHQRDIASKIKYIFIAGDLVDGVGVYPNQEYDLNILDIKDQYAAFAKLMKRIPEHIPILFCPGNHDVGRISEPQPALTADYAGAVLSLPNVVSVSNPSIINIYAQPDQGFDGFDVMFYHGYSFVYYSEKIPIVRKNGGQKRPDLIMKYLLQRRHLAPSHTSTLYIPDPRRDPLVISTVPDFLVSGHVHRAMVSNYKNVTCFNASCWVSQSDEQERRGLEAQPARAFIVNMHTREVKIMNFLSKEDNENQEKTAGQSGQPGQPVQSVQQAQSAQPIQSIQPVQSVQSGIEQKG